MRPARVMVRFFLLLGLSYTLLMMPWPGLRPTYAHVFRASNQFLLGSFGPDGVVRFVAAKKSGDNVDCRLMLSHRNRRTGVETPLSSNVGYSPAAFLTALLIATPMPLRRRALAWMWGMLLLHAAIALKLSIYIVLMFSTDPRVIMFSLSEFWQTTLAELKRLVLFAPFFALVVPTFIWILVTFRRHDIEAILQRTIPNAPAGHRARP